MTKYSQLTQSFLVAIIIAAIMGLGPNPAQAQQCPDIDVGSLKRYCWSYVVKWLPKMQPSARCCGVVRNLDVQCACQYMNKDLEGKISATKAIYVAEYCGLALPHGSQCGSQTVP